MLRQWSWNVRVGVGDVCRLCGLQVPDSDGEECALPPAKASELPDVKGQMVWFGNTSLNKLRFPSTQRHELEKMDVHPVGKCTAPLLKCNEGLSVSRSCSRGSNPYDASCYSPLSDVPSDPSDWDVDDPVSEPLTEQDSRLACKQS